MIIKELSRGELTLIYPWVASINKYFLFMSLESLRIKKCITSLRTGIFMLRSPLNKQYSA